MKKLANLMQNLLDFHLTLLRLIFLSKRVNFTSNSGKAIVLANGPSLRDYIEDENFRKQCQNIDTICVNFFYKSAFFKEIKPKYCIISAPELWQNETGPVYEKEREAMFDFLAKEVDWEFYFLIPVQAKKHDNWQKKLATNPNVKIQYYNITVIEGFQKFEDWCYKRKLGCPRSHNIAGYAIMNLLWLGYSEIGLMGVEHSWTKSLVVTRSNEAILSFDHFYDNEKKKIQMNKDSTGQNKRKLHEILTKYCLTFQSYFDIKRFGDSKNTQIKNLTLDSYIDAFEKIEFNEFID